MWKKLSRLGELPCDRKRYKFVKVLIGRCKSVEGKNFSNNCPAVPNRAVFWLTSSLMVTKLSRAQLDYK